MIIDQMPVTNSKHIELSVATGERIQTTFRKSWLIITALLIVGGLVRFIHIDAHGLWFDEILSVTSANGCSLSVPVIENGQSFTPQDFAQRNTIANVKQAVIWQDFGNAILYNLSLHYWIKLFGSTDNIVRLFSLLCGVVVVLLVYGISTRAFKGQVVWWASGFAVLHPLLIRYSQEARAYALATMLSLLATLIFLHLLQVEKRNWFWSLLYGLTAGTALLTHYLTGYIFITHGLFALLRVRDRKRWLHLLASGILAAAIFGTWQINGGREGMKRITAANQNYKEIAASSISNEKFSAAFTPHYVVAGILQVAYAMSGNSLQKTGLQLRYLLPLLILPVAFLFIHWQSRSKAPSGEGAHLLIIMLAFSGMACSLILALIARHTISFQLSYANFATPYFAMLLGAGMSQAFSVQKRKAWFLRGLVVAQMIVVVLSLYFTYQDASWYRPPNQYAVIAKQIAEKCDSGGSVSYPSWTDALLCNLYLQSLSPVVQKIETASTDNAIIISHSTEPQLKIASPREYWLNLHKKAIDSSSQ